MYLIVLTHELGHITIGIIFKYDIKQIKIYPFGGYTIFNTNINKSFIEEFLVFIGGILFQTILYLLVKTFMNPNLYSYNIFMNYNTTILLFNLLPIIPLDGSKIFNVIVNKIFNFRVSYMINIIISILFLSIFFIYFKSDTSYYLIIIFLLTQIIYNYKNRYIIFNRFILEKKLYKNEYKDFKKIKNIKKMSRNKRHLIKTNNFYVTEKSYMTNLKK